MVSDSSISSTLQKKLDSPLKANCSLQINLGKRCNLACTHCHVGSGAKTNWRTCLRNLVLNWDELILLIPQIKTVDLTGVPGNELWFQKSHWWEAAKANGKQVIVRSNLTIYFEGYRIFRILCKHQTVFASYDATWRQCWWMQGIQC